MDHYLEIRVLPDPEFSEEMLMAALVAKLHRALGQRGQGDIGISFPDYQYNESNSRGSLGRKLRIFAPTEQKLINLKLLDELSKISDYINISDIDEVGDKATGYEVYTRVHTKNLEKEALRLQKHLNAKRGATEQLTYDEVLINCVKWRKGTLNHLFIYIKSNSNEHGYQAHIKRDVLSEPTKNFHFNTFGFSNTDTEKLSSVPWW